MPFSTDQEHAIRLITQTTIEQQLDSRINRRLLILNVWTGVLTVGALGLLIFLFVQLPDIAVGRLRGQLSNLDSQITEAMRASDHAQTAAGAALASAKASAVRADEAETSVAEASRLAQAMDPELMSDALAAARALTHAVNVSPSTQRLIAALLAPPSVLRSTLYNDQYLEQGYKKPGFWRSSGQAWDPMPTKEPLRFTLDSPAVVVVTATGNCRAATDGVIHLGLVDLETKVQLGANWYRASTLDGPKRWHDNGGWAPFTLTSIALLDPGTHELALSALREGDSQWELHNTQLQAMIRPYSLESPTPAQMESQDPES